MEPLVDEKFVLQKMPGKGGWTYAVIPGSIKKKKTCFGLLKVKGFIDGYALENYQLMPMATGQLFFATNAKMRKAIGKQEGDEVHILLYDDEEAELSVSELEIVDCLKDEPKAYAAFSKLSEQLQNQHIQQILAASDTDEKVNRITQLIENLLTQC